MNKCIIIFSFCIWTVLTQQEVGYYWVDYDGGQMPANALKISDDSSDYVGQVYTKAYELLPATIRTYAPHATFNAYNKELNADKNIKVLCSQCNENFRWVKTNATSYRSLEGLVYGGMEVNIPAYIGRIFRNGRAILGKIGLSLALPYQGHEQYVDRDFEVLVHKKCDKDFTNIFLCARNM